jgi:hypothetical protein
MINVTSAQVYSIVTNSIYNTGSPDGNWTVELIHTVPTVGAYPSLVSNVAPTPAQTVTGTTEVIDTYSFDVKSTMVIRANIQQN